MTRIIQTISFSMTVGFCWLMAAPVAAQGTPDKAAAEVPAPPPAASKVSITPYGFIIGNASFNTGSVNSNEAPTLAVRGSTNVKGDKDGLFSDGSFIITPRQTRLGAKMAVAMSDDLKADGKVEVDFWGLHGSSGPGAITQPTIRLRLAYFTFGTKSMKLLVGQNWSVLNNPFPTSLGHIVIPAFTAGGNLWNRLPQITGIYTSEGGLQAKLSLIRPHSGKTAGGGSITQADQTDPGALAAAPMVQGRVQYKTDLVTVGVAGHFGQEKYAITDKDGNFVDPTDGKFLDTKAQSFAGAADVRLTAGNLMIYVEAFVGANLKTLFSLASVRAVPFNDAADSPIADTIETVEPIKSKGGWVQVSYKLTDHFKINAAGGVERIDDDDRDAVGVVENNMVFANIIYSPYKNLDFGLEGSQNITIYTSQPSKAKNINVNLALRMKF